MVSIWGHSDVYFVVSDDVGSEKVGSIGEGEVMGFHDLSGQLCGSDDHHGDLSHLDVHYGTMLAGQASQGVVR